MMSLKSGLAIDGDIRKINYFRLSGIESVVAACNDGDVQVLKREK